MLKIFYAVRVCLNCGKSKKMTAEDLIAVKQRIFYQATQIIFSQLDTSSSSK